MDNLISSNGLPDKLSELSDKEKLLIGLYRLTDDTSKDDLFLHLESEFAQENR